jgi:tetratricopeptide (TPR) repeat protein
MGIDRVRFRCPVRTILVPTLLGLTLLLAAVTSPPARAQGSVSIEPNPQLFATLCALYAAGHDAESGGPVHPLRARIRHQMMSLRGPAVETVRKFYREHRVTNDNAAILSSYVSFALAVGPAPKFEFTLKRDALPPDVASLEGFNEVLAAFYAEADIAALWLRVRGEYEHEVRRLQEPVSNIVLVASSYLRELLDPSSNRRFMVYVEPLVGLKTNVRSYGDLNIIVLDSTGEIPTADMRHAFLHFVLDPLPLRHRLVVDSRKSLLNLAARAPRLPREFREDFATFFTENLVRAAELRLARPRRPDLELALSQNDLEGYALVRPLHRELEKFEQAEPSMARYYPDLVRGINLADETRRLGSLQYAAATLPSADPAPAFSEAEQQLIAAERFIAAKDHAAAVGAFARILEGQPENIRALYGYAVASALQGEAERAKEFFRRLLQPAAASGGAGPVLAAQDPRILSWSHVYLGRIYDVDGSRDLALSEYRAAMAVEGAPEAAKIAARRGIEQGYDAGKDAARRP